MSIETQQEQDAEASPLGEAIFAVALLFAALATAWTSLSYGLGRLSDAGPGLFPFACAVLMAAVALILAVGALRRMPRDDVQPAPAHAFLGALRPPLAIAASLVFFALASPRLGAPLAMAGLVIIAALAIRGRSLAGTLALAAFLAVAASVIFIRLLGVQLPVFPQ